MNYPSLISLDLEWKGCDPRMITGLVELPIRPATRFSLAILALPARKQDDCTRPVNAAAKADNSPRLVELELKDLIWEAAAGVVGRLKNGIEKLAVNGNDAPTPPSTFNAMFAATSHLTSLTELRLIASIASIPDDTKTLDASAVDILFDLPNIVHFEHRSPIVPLLTDAWLERAAVAWPKLRTLTVTFAVYYRPAPKMTLEGLVPLLNTSKYLRELDVQVVCRPFPMDRLEGTQRNGVWKVSFSESVVADHEGLVDCILAMFPLLQVFGGYADQDESGKGPEDWQRVEREWKGARRLRAL